MSLKSGNAVPPPAQSLFSRWSITRQLAWFYALSTSLLLILACGFLYWVLVAILQKEDESTLINRVHVLRTILLEQPEDTIALAREVAEDNTKSNAQENLYSRILDESGRSLVSSADMEREIPLLAFATVQMPAGVKKWRSDNGNTYLLSTTQVTFDTANRPLRRIQVALNITSEEALINRYARYLLGVLLLGVALSTVIGIVAARRGMRPLADITQAAEHITASHLHERIDAGRWPHELVALARAFDDMLDRLEDAFDRLSQFSADLAHELRTPMNNLRGEAEVALSKPRPTQEYRDIIASSLEEYERLSRMTDSLLFLAKADGSQMMANLSVVDAHHEVQKIIDFYEALSTERGVRVTCEGNETVHADTILFQRAINNLLSNALRYTPQGGAITFSILRIDGRQVEVACSDTGIGIASEQLPKIFDRFYRADPSRYAHTDGAGLGLAIVKSIMRLHGGEVNSQSTLSRGTTIRLLFLTA